MKGVVKFLVGVLLGILMGWALGFLRIPTVERNDSFWVGFAACLAFVAFVVGLLFVWNKNRLLLRVIGREPGPEGGRPVAGIYTLVWVVVAVLILAGSGLSSWMIYQQNQLLAAETERQSERIDAQSQLIEAIRKGNQAILLADVLENVDDELDANAGGSLGDAIVARVAALSFSLKPYAFWMGDSLSPRKLSPERGQLLLALAHMGIDSASFARIKRDAPFFGAELGGADLRGTDLSGIDLRGANLRDANLSGADLRGADLWGADLWGADLGEAVLDSAMLRRVDLRWADLNGASLRFANLNGADLSDAGLSRADLYKATFQWGRAVSATMDGAYLREANLYGTVLSRTNLDSANLQSAQLTLAILAEAHLGGALLDSARVDQDWDAKLTQWQISAAGALRKAFTVEKDTTGRFVYGNFLLVPAKAH